MTPSESAAEAYNRFISRNFHGCLDTLHSLASSSTRGDPTIQHNIAVCKYFQGGFAESDVFLRDLEKLTEAGAQPLSKYTGRATEALEDLANQREYRSLCLGFEGQQYVCYNRAVAHFHLRQYREAEQRLQPLQQNCAQLPELLRVRVQLLLLACVQAQYLSSRETTPSQIRLRERAVSLLQGLEESRDFMQQFDTQDMEDGERQRAPLRLGLQAMLLKAHWKGLGEGDHGGAVQLLHDFVQKARSDWWQQVAYLNNLGALHMNVGKPYLASLYFAKGVALFEQHRQKPGGEVVASTSTHPGLAGLMYNNAINCMIRGEYQTAFRCLLVTWNIYHDTPILWIRLAQCCVRQWEINAEKAQQQELKVQPGSTRRVVHFPTQQVGRSDPAPPASSQKGAAQAPEPGGSEDMSLLFADKCLRNAHFLLFRRRRAVRRAKGRADASPARGADGEEEAEDGGMPHEAEIHEALCQDEQTSVLLQCVYCNMAHVALCLNNPAVALTAARKLLSLPSSKVYREYRVVSISYCVEALCALNRPQEALALLRETKLAYLLQGEPSLLKLPARGTPPARATCAAELPGVGEGPIYLGTPSERDQAALTRRHAAALFTNLCVVHIMSGKYSRAQQCLDQCKAESQPVAHLLQVYLHLAQGRKADAVGLVARSPPVPYMT